MKTKYLEEHDIPEGPFHMRLGRHVEHDPRSRAFAVEPPVKLTLGDLRTVVHRRYGGVFDQGDLGSCTGNAMAGVINTMPTHIANHSLLVEKDAVMIYSRATKNDAFKGYYPPTDTGSSGVAVARVAKNLGFITEYKHAFSIESALVALMDRPVITGIPWLDGMDEPDEDGMVTATGEERGGHEIEALGIHVPAHIKSYLDVIIEFENSWTAEWGNRGRFYMTARDWATLLQNDGDVTVPIRS